MNFDVQKASLLKRFSAWMLDAILLLMLGTAFCVLASSLMDFDGQYDKLQGIYEKYEKEYGIAFDKLPEDMSEEEQALYNAADEALQKDDEALYYFTRVIYIILGSITAGLLLSFLILEFFVPLLLKNGQTVGKKIFGIGLMRVDGVRITPFALFARAVLGKFTIETMLPLITLFMTLMGMFGLVGLMIPLILLLVQIVVMVRTETNSMIHDHLAVTVAVDLASQMIFETPEDLMAYKNRLHEEKVSQTPYF